MFELLKNLMKPVPPPEHLQHEKTLKRPYEYYFKKPSENYDETQKVDIWYSPNPETSYKVGEVLPIADGFRILRYNSMLGPINTAEKDVFAPVYSTPEDAAIGVAKHHIKYKNATGSTFPPRERFCVERLQKPSCTAQKAF